VTAQPYAVSEAPLPALSSRRVFGGDRIKNLMVAFRVEDLPMESQMLTDALDTAQKRVESYFYDIRK
jgi:preprotein translocase subunit SecA